MMLEHCLSIANPVVLGALHVEQCTYVRTHSHRTTHLSSYLTFGNARRGAERNA